MTPRIYISPSSQTGNTYAYGGTNEAEQCRKIAVELTAALKRCDMEAMTNTTPGKTMYDRVAESNKWGASLHVPIHTNACNRKVTGTRIMCYDLKGDGYKASVAVYNELAPITPGKSENISAHPELYEIRAAKSPVVYIEVEFHDNAEAAKWIVENTDAIAEAICKGICKHYGVRYIAPEPEAQVTEEPGGGIVLSTLSKGGTGQTVKALQLLLNGNGCNAGTADGVFGSKTETALKDYQKAKNLTVDGVCGIATWKSLLGVT